MVALVLIAVLFFAAKAEGENTGQSSGAPRPSSEPVVSTEEMMRSMTNRERVMYYISFWAAYYGYPDIKKAEAIVSCEGGFDDPTVCNIGPDGERRCTHGQGHAQFIPSTWASLQKAIGVKDVFDTSDNIQALIYLLQKDGDRHWRPYSGHCWVPKLEVVQ